MAIPLAVVAVSFAAIFVRLSDSHPISISFHRMLFSTLVLSIFVPNYLEDFKRITNKGWFVLLSAGFFLAAHMGLWVASLDYTTVASSVVLVTSHPLLVAWISSHYLGEKTSKRAYLSIILALGGITIMAVTDYKFSEWGLFGDFLALLSMIAVTGYIIRGRQMRKKLSVIPYVFTVYGFSTLFLGVFSLFFSTSFKIYPIREYLLFIALALIPTMLGHTVYNWALKHVKTRVASVSLLGEPIGASILAFLILNEVPPNLTILGAIIALIGIFLCEKYG
ncbi:hypothetical protein AKJ50_00050 [candidate division MSBL1 archaeon SCGC-AAA382A13]|uniref:EamA domain-containing protein n=1 Tax=candidate division MSBL1 archaeon SCGC-AAA382A13 TaxID=1698279 RepID=A0A133VH17_9EURY|nr:hypothetical protein AKJ50_00050 [candidate division MSBL1 archaeon SCGC-AAA382A13]